MAACNAANYQYYGDWQELPMERKAHFIAHYIIDIMIENHKADAMNQEMERASRKRGGRSKGKS